MSTDVATIKQAARGRWPEILTSLGGISAELLDRHHHPCPKCGGTDRFRAFDDFSESGGVICNQCHAEKNSDGISTLMWATGSDFKAAVKILADYLHLNGNGKANGHTHRTPKKAASPATLAKGIEPIDHESQILDAFLGTYGKVKPPISVQGVKGCGGNLVTWCGYRCIRLDGRATIDKPTITAVVLLRLDGKLFPAVGKVRERKTHTTKGSIDSWLVCGDVATAETIIDLEGVTDLLAIASVGLPPGWAAVTNTAGAKARGKLPREWAKGKRIIVVGDTDEPGQEGQRRAVAAYVQAGAAEVLLAQLPYPIEKDHGKDLRDWLNEGHAVADLPTEAVTAEQAAEWSKAATSKLAAQITNAEVFDDGESTTVLPLRINEIIGAIAELTNGELRRIGNALFVHAPGRPLDWIKSPSSLFGWMQSRHGIIQWRRSTGCVTKDELFAELQRQAPAFTAVESLPHWPPIPGHYYTCDIPTPGNGHALEELIGMHCLEADLDRELALAMYATGAWGGPPGMRPAWLVTSTRGRGKGKSIFCQHYASTFGGSIDISPQEDIGIIKQRFLSPEARSKRTASIDNLKMSRFSWAELEAMIMAATISGKEMYVGEGSRPNLITWTITLNGARLSTDMAQRVVEIHLREPDYDASWEERVQGFIDTNQERIIADCVGLLQQPAKPMKRHSRWATWEASVLSRIDHPDECLLLILDRRGAVDVEAEESEIIEDYFAHMLIWLGYDPERDDVFIFNDIAALWFNKATGDKVKVTGATRALKQLHDEGRAHRIIYSRASGGAGRGFRWVGQHADASDVTHYDIRERLAAKLQEQRQPNGGEIGRGECRLCQV